MTCDAPIIPEHDIVPDDRVKDEGFSAVIW